MTAFETFQSELPPCWDFSVQIGLAFGLAYFFTPLSLHHLLCVAHSLVFNKILQGNSIIKWKDTREGSSRGCFWNCIPKIWNLNLEPIRDLLAKPDILRNWLTANNKFTWKKSIDTFLTLSFTDWKKEVEHDFSEGLSSRVILKFGRQLPNLTKLFVPQEFRLGEVSTFN